MAKLTEVGEDTFLEENDSSKVTFSDENGEKVLFSKQMEVMSGRLDDSIIDRVVSAIGHAENFTCYIYQKKKGDFSQKQVARVENTIPDPDEVGKEVGGGKLHYVIKAPPKGGKGRPIHQDFYVELGENYDEVAEDNRITRMQKRYLPTPQKDSISERMVVALMDKAFNAPQNDSSMILIKMMESQNQMMLRFAEMQRESENRTRELIKELKSESGSDLTKTIAMITALKEASSLFGGGEKSLVSEILESITPLAQTVVEGITGRKSNTPQIEHETEQKVDPNVLISEIVEKIDIILNAIESAGALKRKIIISKIKSDASVQSILSNPSYLEKVRKGIGDEKFNKLMGYIQGGK